MRASRRSSCERARFLAALAPDQELTELEVRYLVRHLDRCEGCRVFARSVAMIAHQLRATPRLEPSPVAVQAARSTSRLRHLVQLPVVALMATAVALVLTSAALHDSHARSEHLGVHRALGEDDRAVLPALRAVVHSRQVMPDYRPDSPGIYLG